jgi:hypothetical protein
LQGFPDTFKCHPDDKFAYKQFGNAVTVPVVKEVLKDFLSNNLQALRWWDSITVKYPQLSDQSKHIFLPS